MTARIGVVGIGWWATFNHIPTINDCPEAEVVAICDLDQSRLNTAGEKFGIAARYTDVAAMMAAENLDGVMISTPHIFHTDPAICALNGGAHVLVEKPMATRAADGRAIAAAAKAAGREVLVPTGLNFEEYTVKARDWVANGRIGEVRHIVCQMGSPLHDLLAGEPMLETADHLFRPPASTWADPTKAGGYAWGQMSHSLAWMIHVTGLTVTEVYCASGLSPSGVDFYDAATARASNGATIALSGASTVPKHKGMHTDVRIYGTEGMILFDNQKASIELWRLDADDDFLTLDRAEYDGALPVQVFAKLCAGQDVFNASNADCGAEVTATIAALYKSAASQKTEPVE
ncbi:MAG: putative dehydrogenase [Sulfitobacter sp.]|jgi:predicted dehydrogenase